MTVRGLPNEITTYLDAATLQVFFAVELLFDSPNELRFWTGVGDLDFEGDTYTGTGDLMQISELQESSDIAARGATLTLSGIPSNLINLAIDEPYQGRIAKIKFGVFGQGVPDGSFLTINDAGDYLLLNDAGDKLKTDYADTLALFDMFVGRMDQMTIADGGDTSTISLTVESKLIDLERARSRRYTDNNQQSRFPGDLAFQFVTRLQDENLTWGS